MSTPTPLSKQERIDRLIRLMKLLDLLYQEEPHLLTQTDWCPNINSYNHMIYLIKTGAV